MTVSFILVSVFCLVCTAMPFLENKHWTIRMFDFPHLQVTILTFIGMVGMLLFGQGHWSRFF